jgi:hypothetical protein
LNPTYSVYIQDLLDRGRLVHPRGLECHEVLNYQLETTPGEIPQTSKLNVALGFTEMFSLLAGVLSKFTLALAAPRADQNLFGSQSAYGPRVGAQLQPLVNELKRDPDSRRALLLVGRPEESSTAALPCTTVVQFLVRDGLLHAIVNLRSSDAVWGIPYDVMQFGGLSMAVAHLVGTTVGPLHFNLGSAHVYEDTLHLAPGGASPGPTPGPPPAYPLRFAVDFPAVGSTWGAIHRWAEYGLYTIRQNKRGKRRVDHLTLYRDVPSGPEVVETW